MKNGTRTTVGALALSTLLALSGCTTTDGLGDGSISCTNRLDDWWRVSVSGETAVTISVDTVSFDTAFDPAIDIYEVVSWGFDTSDTVVGAFVSSADDDFECTYPPPSFECPSESVVATADFLVVVENLGNCRGSVGHYRLDALGADAVTYLGQEP